MTGNVLIYDLKLNKYFSNSKEQSQKGYLPASTFKIVNALIAFDKSIATDTNFLFKWDGKKRRMSVWEKDMNFKEAYNVSCVPCFQQIAKAIGVTEMNRYLKMFDYGNMIVNENSIDNFWLEGESKISQFQQVEFLKKLYFKKFPISNESYDKIKSLILLDNNNNYKLFGKTGWSIRNDHNYGWFVGFIEVKSNVYFFATFIEPEDQKNLVDFTKARKEITIKALKFMKIIE